MPGVAKAIRESNAYVIYVSSISDAQGETRGFGVKDQVEALQTHGMGTRIDCVIADAPRSGSQASFPQGMRRVSLGPDDRAFLREQGIVYMTRDFYNPEHPGWHSVSVLRSALGKSMGKALERALPQSASCTVPQTPGHATQQAPVSQQRLSARKTLGKAQK